MKSNFSAIVFSTAIVLAAIFLGDAYVNRNKTAGDIQVTGSGNFNFTSDLIVWEGSFGAINKDLQAAYASLENQKEIISKYLVAKGIAEESIVFNAVSNYEKTKRKYNSNGDFVGEEFVGYSLTQRLQIESNEVEKTEKIAREVTELLNQGVQFYSQAPRYYYTKLADLKIEMISKATEDARQRAEKIAENAGGELGELKSARMGVFQITGQNSNEEYSWGGTYNTSDKHKTASITMKLVYEVED